MPSKIRVPSSGLWKKSSALLALGVILVVTQSGAQAQVSGPLKFFQSNFVAGDYVAAGVGLDKTGSHGLVGGNVTIDAKDATHPDACRLGRTSSPHFSTGRP